MSSANVAEGSEASSGRYRPANSNDPGWNNAQPADGNKDHVKCNFCGTVFLKSIDGSAHIHDVKLIYKILKDVIEEVGEKNVIQICTDNTSNYVLAGDWIMAESKIYWMSLDWWINFGSEVSALQIFAKRVLGLTSAASPCKRIWSTIDNWSGGSILEVKSPPYKYLLKEFLGLLVRLLLVKGFGVPLTISRIKRGIVWSMIG
ncbi:hypothetical protein GIB67_002782 [Kingdonia uniflora]|uniref:DUF659 domain-containing protein n=1 Tax=Kingdonia uniflora TaxID=39325 RepID=A0A7J7NSR4_9MAGN|nr:hypothetical protein GIB67_002782 [Kingdonia uniflora]